MPKASFPRFGSKRAGARLLSVLAVASLPLGAMAWAAAVPALFRLVWNGPSGRFTFWISALVDCSVCCSARICSRATSQRWQPRPR